MSIHFPHQMRYWCYQMCWRSLMNDKAEDNLMRFKKFFLKKYFFFHPFLNQPNIFNVFSNFQSFASLFLKFYFSVKLVMSSFFKWIFKTQLISTETLIFWFLTIDIYKTVNFITNNWWLSLKILLCKRWQSFLDKFSFIKKEKKEITIWMKLLKLQSLFTITNDLLRILQK